MPVNFGIKIPNDRYIGRIFDAYCKNINDESIEPRETEEIPDEPTLSFILGGGRAKAGIKIDNRTLSLAPTSNLTQNDLQNKYRFFELMHDSQLVITNSNRDEAKQDYWIIGTIDQICNDIYKILEFTTDERSDDRTDLPDVLTFFEELSESFGEAYEITRR